jgi:hypothetical protein
MPLSAVAVLYSNDAKADGLTGFIAPVGPVGGDANLNGADAVLGDQREGEKGEDDESKHGLELNTIPRLARERR